MRCLILMFLLVTVIVGGVALPADTLRPQKLVVLVSEDYRYSIDFLKLRNLAEGSLRFTAEPQPGRYRAELEGRTRGLASWLTGERTQRYTAIMEQVGGGGFRSVSYESSILKYKGGKWSKRSKRYRFDYQAGKVILDKGEGGYFKTVKEYPLPAEQTPVDILTGFYNLRAGVYGALFPGAHLRIPTFTTKGVSFIAIEVLTKPAGRKKFFPYGGTLLRIRVDSEVFETGGSEDDIYLWFDLTGRPALGIVENLIGMGDVYGRLDQDLGEVYVKP